MVDIMDPKVKVPFGNLRNKSLVAPSDKKIMANHNSRIKRDEMTEDIMKKGVKRVSKEEKFIVQEYNHKDFEEVLNMDGRPSKRRADKFKLLECSDAFYCYVAREGRRIVGFIIMEDLGDGISHYMVQVNSTEKRKGIGRRLVQEVFQRIGHGGHISLCVNTDNETAIRFYESLGFKRSGFTEGYRKGQNKFWYQIDS
jgi:ribosomal protein S18 acetylase RimI-like enzyme